jgi:hypothetical protein
LVQWWLLETHSAQSKAGRGGAIHRALFSGTLGDGFALDVGGIHVRVPSEGVRYRLTTDPEETHALSADALFALSPVLRAPEAARATGFREALIRDGDHLRFTGWVAPVGDGAGYRERGGFTVVLDRAEAVVEERRKAL